MINMDLLNRSALNIAEQAYIFLARPVNSQSGNLLVVAVKMPLEGFTIKSMGFQPLPPSSSA